jgi:hypothetical protein
MQEEGANHILCGTEYPHKVDTLYGQQGRIGIYTPNQRSKLLAKFREKRTKRCWRKIRYNVRKNIANKKIRINGRFAPSQKSKNSNKKKQAARAQAKAMNAHAHAQVLAKVAAQMSMHVPIPIPVSVSQ